MITLHRLQKGGRDCYQAVLVSPTGEIKSPLFLERGEVVKWALGVLKAQPTASPSKAGV